MDTSWVQYTNAALGIALSRPAHWQVQQLKPTQFVISGPEEESDYRPQISYQRAEPDGTGEAWFQETIRYSEEQQRAAYADYKLVRSEELTLAGARAFWRHSEWRYENTGIYSVNLQVLIWPNAKTIYVLKAATLKSLAERDVPIFERIIQSTKLL